jgi:hypothetical protein
MRLSRDELVWKALLAIDEVAERAEKAPAEKSLFLRFTLAFLYCEGDAGALRVFRDFWRAVTSPVPEEYTAQVGRLSAITGGLNGVFRAVRVERTVTMMQYVKAARSLEKRIPD